MRHNIWVAMEMSCSERAGLDLSEISHHYSRRNEVGIRMLRKEMDFECDQRIYQNVIKLISTHAKSVAVDPFTQGIASLRV